MLGGSQLAGLQRTHRPLQGFFLRPLRLRVGAAGEANNSKMIFFFSVEPLKKSLLNLTNFTHMTSLSRQQYPSAQHCHVASPPQAQFAIQSMSAGFGIGHDCTIWLSHCNDKTPCQSLHLKLVIPAYNSSWNCLIFAYRLKNKMRLWDSKVLVGVILLFHPALSLYAKLGW